MKRLHVTPEVRVVLGDDATARLSDPRMTARCALCAELVGDTGAAVALTDGTRTVAVVTHPACRASAVVVVDAEVLTEQLAIATTSRTHLAVGPGGHPAVLVTTVHAGVLVGEPGARTGDAAVPLLLAQGMVRLPGLPQAPPERLAGWDATLHPDRMLEVTGPDGAAFVVGDPGVAPGGDRWWRRAAADGIVTVAYVGGVHGDAGLTLGEVDDAVTRGELVGGGVRWRDRSGGHR